MGLWWILVVWATPPLSLTPVDAAQAKQADTLNVEGLKLHKAKKYADAEAKYEAALAANPGHLFARYNLACVHNLAGRPERGLELLQQLVDATDCAACRGI